MEAASSFTAIVARLQRSGRCAPGANLVIAPFLTRAPPRWVDTATADARRGAKATLAAVRATFERDVAVRAPAANPALARVYTLAGGEGEGECGAGPYSAAARALLHTRYHAVPELDNPLRIRW